MNRAFGSTRYYGRDLMMPGWMAVIEDAVRHKTERIK